MDDVDVYAVGFVADFMALLRTIRYVPKHTRTAWRRLRFGLRDDWRRRSYWNGYLAEPTSVPSPERPWWRCGHGWTKQRALRDLNRHLADAARVWTDPAAALRGDQP